MSVRNVSERTFSKQYTILNLEDRLEKVAEDIVSHFTARGQAEKGESLASKKRLHRILSQARRESDEALGENFKDHSFASFRKRCEFVEVTLGLSVSPSTMYHTIA